MGSEGSGSRILEWGDRYTQTTTSRQALQGQLNRIMPMQLFKERVLTFNTHARILRNLLMATILTDLNFSEPAMKKMLA